MRVRAVAGGIALAFTPGFNVANIGAVADRIAHTYGVGLGVVGLFTTGLFVTHAAMQVPAGRLCDRFDARTVGGVGLLVVAGASFAAAFGPRDAAFAIGMRTVAGLGTAGAFVGGSDYVRATIGSAVAQGVYGAVSMAAGGLALALVPLWASWRAPFVLAAVIATAGAVVLVFAPEPRTRPQVARRLPTVFDRRLLPLATLHAASFGLSIIVGNWVVTLLQRSGGDSERVAGVAGGLVLLVGVVSRPLGGRFVDRPRIIAAGFVLGGVGMAGLAVAKPLPLVVVAAVLVGFSAGLPFAPSFTGAARARPDAPGAAIGAVNMAAAVLILVGTPIVGLTFSLPGGGRSAFVVIAVLWAATATVVHKALIWGAE
ncbi:MAG TPA: MFS transporter [Gaiellaceae bacterium]|nr:MFS transporter [Gaiellaceae bacterium]